MLFESEEILNLGIEQRTRISQLSSVSHIKPMSMNSLTEWGGQIDKSIYPKPKENICIYGTEYYDLLSENERLDMAWLETGRDVSMFIWLEQTLPMLYVGYINKYINQLSSEIKEYLMIFSKEEIVHTLVFKNYMKLADLKLWNPPEYARNLLINVLPNSHPALGIFFTLLLEWIAESGAMYNVENRDNVEPMTKKIFTEHHREESRHIIFGKLISKEFFKNAPQQDISMAKKIVNELFPILIQMYSYNPELSDHVDCTFPVQKSDHELVKKIQNSTHNKKINGERFRDIRIWLDGLRLYE